MKKKYLTRVVYWVMSLILITGCKQNQTEETFVFKNVNLIPMTSEKVVPNQTVLIVKKRIVKTGKDRQVKIPKNATIIDGTGKFLFPGLADMHTHIGETLTKSYLNLFVSYGVTTVRDLPQGSPPSILSLREEIKSGKRFGPQLFVANHLIGFEAAPEQNILPTKNCGYDGVKLNSLFTTDAFQKTVSTANRSGLYAFGHFPFLMSLDEILNSGYRESSHILELAWYLSSVDVKSAPNAEVASDRVLKELFGQIEKCQTLTEQEQIELYRPRIKAIVDKIGTREISFCTTLIADYDIMNKVLNLDEIRNSSYAPYISAAFWNDIKSGTDKQLNLFPNPADSKIIYLLDCLFLKELIAQNKFIVLGTDVGPTYLSIIPGYSVHQELKLLVENGLTPYQALLTATKNAAVIGGRMSGRDDFGTIVPGNRADLLLLDKNPLEDIGNSLTISGVFIQGDFYTRNRLDSIQAIDMQSLKKMVLEQYKSRGINEAINYYQSLKNDNFFNRYFYNENTLVIIGYELIKTDSLQDALKIFQLNAKEYPTAPNAFDCLGEVYLRLNDRPSALVNYKKALQIDPNFANSKEQLAELEKKVNDEENK